MKSLFGCVVLAVSCCSTGSRAICQETHREPAPAKSPIDARNEPRSSEALRQFNSSLIALTRKVSPAVVQVIVTVYGPPEGGDRNGRAAVIVREHAIGSGVILDPDGYIVTNAHVVQGARRIRVALPDPVGTSPFDVPAAGKRRVLDAKLIGIHKDIDLAVLKVDAHNLPTLQLGAGRPVYPGEVVLAVGSPEGLENSVTMGIVSSVWRQPDPDQPMVYLQTDAPINPGNSGGPLVDLDGYVVGLNTLILTEGGGSEGIGFAIPAHTVRFVYEELRKYGHVHRMEIGASVEEITPTLAEGLGLSQDWGVIISDVVLGEPAAQAGLRAQDIVTSLDNHPIGGLPALMAGLYLHPPSEDLRLEVLRGSQRMSVILQAVEERDQQDSLADFVDPNNLIGRLGVFVVDTSEKVNAVLPARRIESGIVVVAQSPGSNPFTSALRAGDIIHNLNQSPVESVLQFRTLLRALQTGQSVVLQIERGGKLQYVPFTWGD